MCFIVLRCYCVDVELIGEQKEAFGLVIASAPSGWDELVLMCYECADMKQLQWKATISVGSLFLFLSLYASNELVCVDVCECERVSSVLGRCVSLK